METPDGPFDGFWAGLEPGQPYLDEETLIRLIEARVQQLLTEQPTLLWSFLYRLDVEEFKIQQAMTHSGSVALELARLILQRQRERLATQKKYRPDSSQNPYDWGDL